MIGDGRLEIREWGGRRVRYKIKALNGLDGGCWEGVGGRKRRGGIFLFPTFFCSFFFFLFSLSFPLFPPPTFPTSHSHPPQSRHTNCISFLSDMCDRVTSVFF